MVSEIHPSGGHPPVPVRADVPDTTIDPTNHNKSFDDAIAYLNTWPGSESVTVAFKEEDPVPYQLENGKVKIWAEFLIYKGDHRIHKGAWIYTNTPNHADGVEAALAFANLYAKLKSAESRKVEDVKLGLVNQLKDQILGGSLAVKNSERVVEETDGRLKKYKVTDLQSVGTKVDIGQRFFTNDDIMRLGRRIVLIDNAPYTKPNKALPERRSPPATPPPNPATQAQPPEDYDGGDVEVTDPPAVAATFSPPNPYTLFPGVPPSAQKGYSTIPPRSGEPVIAPFKMTPTDKKGLFHTGISSKSVTHLVFSELHKIIEDPVITPQGKRELLKKSLKNHQELLEVYDERSPIRIACKEAIELIQQNIQALNDIIYQGMPKATVLKEDLPLEVKPTPTEFQTVESIKKTFGYENDEELLKLIKFVRLNMDNELQHYRIDETGLPFTVSFHKGQVLILEKRAEDADIPAGHHKKGKLAIDYATGEVLFTLTENYVNTSLEAHIHQQVSDKPDIHIARLEDWMVIKSKDGKDKIRYVMKYYDGGTMVSQVASERKYEYFRQIVEAVQYMHSKGYIHRDIHPGNILINKDGAFLADFGIACHKGALTDICNMKLIAPEVIKSAVEGDKNYRGDGTNWDQFALGILFYCMMKNIKYEDFPPTSFPKDDWNAYYNNYITFWRALPNETDEDKILKKMLHPEPDQRYSIDQLVNVAKRLQ